MLAREKVSYKKKKKKKIMKPTSFIIYLINRVITRSLLHLKLLNIL